MMSKINKGKPQKLDFASFYTPQCVPLSQIQSPGRILQSDKGCPGFYNHFLTLYEDYRTNLIECGYGKPNYDATILIDEERDLLKIIRTMFKYHKIQLFVEGKEPLVEMLDFLKTIIDVVYSYPREFFEKFDSLNMYIFTDKEEASYKGMGTGSSYNCFVVKSFQTKEEIAKKVEEFLKFSVAKATDQIVSKWKGMSREASLVSMSELKTNRSYAKNVSILKGKHISVPSSDSQSSTDIGGDDVNQVKPKKKLESPRVLFGSVTIVSHPSRFQKGS